jgi:acyl transferase domain-containing protein
MTGYESAIAIIGMTGRFPGAPTVAALWQNIIDGVSSIQPVTDADLTAAGVPPAVAADPKYVKAAAPIDDADLFDAGFFGFSPREAEVTDPQHRLFLECAWEALEVAGYHPDSLPGPVGVYAGSGFPTYLQHHLANRKDLLESVDRIQLGIGNDRDSLSSMVSYKLDLRGPGVSVQTFCSTSLIAVHLACQGLLTYDCDLALAGGVAIDFPQRSGYLYQEGGILSPDGECRTFDAKAQGSIVGDGLGVVALKRAEDAQRDGDHIHALILASAINNDGAVRAGYTAPGTDGQAAVIASALRNAGIPESAVSYVECHGTGTLLGDSVELAAMNRVFRGLPPRSCVVGSLKPNIGHLDRASGVAGLIKVALMLEHGVLPPSRNFESPNPELEGGSQAGPFYVNTVLQPWRTGSSPRRAGVSSFGLGGTNAHVVLEQSPAAGSIAGGEVATPQLLTLSAKTAGALTASVGNLQRHLANDRGVPLADIAFTLQSSRSQFNHRWMVLAHDHDDAAAALADPSRQWWTDQNRRGRPVTLVFPDPSAIDARWTGKQPLAHPAYRDGVAQCEAALGIGLDSVTLAQARFVWQYATGRAVLGTGAEVDRCIGTGAGALVAACLSGESSLAEAIAAVPGAGGGEWPAGAGAVLADEDRLAVFVGAPPGEQPDRTGALVIPGPDAGAGSALWLLAGRLWLAGARVDWAGLHAPGRRRVPLPTYPFERRRYWPEPQPAPAGPGASAAAGRRCPDLADWFYVPAWRRRSRVLPVDLPGTAREHGPWLVYAGASPVSGAMVAALRAADARVVVVRPGSTAARLGLDEYAVRPWAAQDHAWVLADSGATPRTIVLAWQLDPGPVAATFDIAQERGFRALLALTGPAVAEADRPPSEVMVLTAGAVRVIGQDLTRPEQASVVGACRVLAQENPQTVYRHVDIDPAGAAEPLARQLLAEVGGASRSVAFRGLDRWVEDFEPFPLPAVAAPAAGLRPRGVCLITGGLGAVGLLLADHLARTRAARLVLVGRTSMPPRDEWRQWLARHDPDEPVAARITRIRAMEAAGAQVLTLAADVADAGRMREVVAQTRNRFGALHGVIHGAGASDPGTFGLGHQLDRNQCEAHFRPKVDGFLALREAVAGAELDLRLTMSSLSSVLGGLGFAAYAAANGVMDAMALAGNDAGRTDRWLTVNWEGWLAGPERHPLAGATASNLRMAPEEAMQVFERLLAHAGAESQVVNSATPLAARLAQWTGEPAPVSRSTPRYPRPALATAYLAPRTAVEARVAHLWMDLLGVEPVGVDDDFFELGGHSLLAVRLLARLREEFGRPMSIRTLIERRTVRGLSPVLAGSPSGDGAGHEARNDTASKGAEEAV